MDTIEKQILLSAPRGRVWRALSDAEEFGAWFGVKLDGPFREGATLGGNITHPGYEHVKWEMVIERIEPERLFSFRWHPYAGDPDFDYSDEPMTLIELRLEERDAGTLLTVVESGFDRIPPARRKEAFIRNEKGWEAQMKNIEAHVAGAAA